jgi:hypothetical protein
MKLGYFVSTTTWFKGSINPKRYTITGYIIRIVFKNFALVVYWMKDES